MGSGRRAAIVAGAATLAGLVVAATPRAPATSPTPRPVAPRPTGGAAERNIARGDYVGPAVCGGCHVDKHASWRAGLHARMNQLATAASVRGAFDGATLAYAGGRARFAWLDGAPSMELVDRGGVRRRYRVTRTIGVRHLQEYVGVQVDGPAAGDPATEVRLPFGYWLDRPGWYPQPYYDSWFPAEWVPPREGARGARGDGDRVAFDAFVPEPTPWAARCAWCHNTAPFELRALRAEGSDLGQGLERFVRWIGAPDPRAAALATSNLLPLDQLVTVGISCESCHLGGRHHAVDGAAIAFVPRAPELALRDDAAAPELARGRASPAVVLAICGGCHSTPTPRWPDGAAQRNSSEALDLAGSACAARARCVDCHDPHRVGPGAGAPDQAAHIEACLGCHPALRDPAAARRHARHDAADASCLDCHMPRVVQGLGQMVRSHRIGAPTPRADAPDACGLCHLDRGVAWLRAELRRGWGTASAAVADPAADAPVGARWLASDDGALRIAAAHAAARAARPGVGIAELVRVLDDPVAHDRAWLLLALERTLGRRLSAAEYDPLAPPAARAAQAARLRSRPPRAL
jgi:hypothetical protein